MKGTSSGAVSCPNERCNGGNIALRGFSKVKWGKRRRYRWTSCGMNAITLRGVERHTFLFLDTTGAPQVTFSFDRRLMRKIYFMLIGGRPGFDADFFFQ